MQEKNLGEIRGYIEETLKDTLENVLENRFEKLAYEMKTSIKEACCNSASETFQEGIEQFLYTHEFKLSDGTIIQGRPMTKVMNPDKTKLLVCYGGLRVDGCSLIVQTAITCWEDLCYFESPKAASDALKKVAEAIEQEVPLLEL